MADYTAPPVHWDHELIIGDTYQPVTLALADADGAAYDLTGVTGEAQVRTGPQGELMLEPTVTITSASTGRLTWSSVAAATAALLPQGARYAVRRTWPSGVVRTVVEGRVTIRRSVVS